MQTYFCIYYYVLIIILPETKPTFSHRVFVMGKKCEELMEGKRRTEERRDTQGWDVSGSGKEFFHDLNVVAEQKPREKDRQVRR